MRDKMCARSFVQAGSAGVKRIGRLLGGNATLLQHGNNRRADP